MYEIHARIDRIERLLSEATYRANEATAREIGSDAEFLNDIESIGETIKELGDRLIEKGEIGEEVESIGERMKKLGDRLIEKGKIEEEMQKLGDRLIFILQQKNLTLVTDAPRYYDYFVIKTMVLGPLNNDSKWNARFKLEPGKRFYTFEVRNNDEDGDFYTPTEGWPDGVSWDWLFSSAGGIEQCPIVRMQRV